MSMMMPMRLKMLMRSPVIRSSPMAPMKLTGSENMMVNGCMKLSNWEARIM